MVASCQPPLACKGKNKSIDTIAILITPRADCGAEGRCSGEGMVPHSSGRARETRGMCRSPSARCWLQPGRQISAEIIPALMRSIPSSALQLFSPENTSLGQSMFNPVACPSWEWPFPTGSALGRVAPPGSLHMPQHLPGERQKGWGLQFSAAALPPQTCLSTSSAGTNLPYVSANRGNCWNQCLIGFRLWQTACRYIFLCQSRRGRRGPRELGDAEWK